MLESKSQSCLCSLFITASLICGAYFIGSAYLSKELKEKLLRSEVNDGMQISRTDTCKKQCRPLGTEALPQGIIAKTSNLEMQRLWSYDVKKRKKSPSMSLLALAVGIKQKDVVNRIITKFPPESFAVMLFHYDGAVDEWKTFPWNDRVIHVSAMNQTKWWFSKRFLHPDIIAEYDYIFLWDEDIGVENFNPKRYLSIVKDEGLEISQPALDTVKSEVHHPITARRKNKRTHRRMYKNKGSGRCDEHSTSPPCVGWVEMMVPVFSRAAWRCAWHMIQNDLIHAWGLDYQLGYCAQGDRKKNVGVVDAEYIVHYGLPTLGVAETELILGTVSLTQNKNFSNLEAPTPSEPREIDNRPEVRKQSFIEMQKFKQRWKKAVKEDKCWVDPY